MELSVEERTFLVEHVFRCGQNHFYNHLASKISGSFSSQFFSGVQWKSQYIRTISTQLMIWRWLSQNTFRMRTVLYRTRSSRTQFGVSINVWKEAGDTLNIASNFLYHKHQVHRDFLITLYKRTEETHNSETHNSFLFYQDSTNQEKWDGREM
jgi:hypothetical protein